MVEKSHSSSIEPMFGEEDVMASPTQLWTRNADARGARDAGDVAPAAKVTGMHRCNRGRWRSSPARSTRPCPSRPGTAARSHPAARRVGLAPSTTEPPRRRTGALAAVAVVTFAMVCGLMLLGQVGAALREAPRETSVVRVGAGETVWDVAERVAPGSDVRAAADRIRRLNGISDSAIEPGRLLRVPGAP
jgi:hypothetical protein